MAVESSSQDVLHAGRLLLTGNRRLLLFEKVKERQLGSIQFSCTKYRWRHIHITYLDDFSSNKITQTTNTTNMTNVYRAVKDTTSCFVPG